MSELRTQLQQMRDAYHSTRYGGDLATETLGTRGTTARRSPVMRIVAATATISALAAAVAFWLVIRPEATPTLSDEVAMAEVETIVPAVADLSTMPEFPQDVSLVPSAESLEMPTMPEMPSFDLSFTLDEETKESV